MEKTNVHQTENSVHTLTQIVPQDYVSEGGEVKGLSWMSVLLFYHLGGSSNCFQLPFGSPNHCMENNIKTPKKSKSKEQSEA